MELPSYINRPTGYDMALPGPYLQQDVTMRCYAFAAQKTALTDMCERYLNNTPGAQYTYTPLSHHVIAVFANMARVSSADPDMGSMHEIDVSLFVPVMRHKKGSLFPDGIAVFMPYLFVNNDWALITGREGGLGFRKNIGLSFFDQTISAGTDPEHARILNHVSAWVIQERNKDARLTQQRLMELTGDHLTAEIEEPFETPGHLIEEILKKLLGRLEADIASRVLKFIQDHDKGAAAHIPVVYLKQYRDARISSAAVLQEVFESDGVMPVDTFRGGGIISGQHQLSFANPVSHPIALELGVNAHTPIDVEFAFEVDCDFLMNLRQ